jgi:hypothetical protein
MYFIGEQFGLSEIPAPAGFALPRIPPKGTLIHERPSRLGISRR